MIRGKIMKFNDEHFTDKKIILDENEYYNCDFKNCVIDYSGGKPPTLVDCKFGNPRFSFSGAAVNTLSFMSVVYKEFGDYGKNLMEATFENIRKNRRPGID